MTYPFYIQGKFWSPNLVLFWTYWSNIFFGEVWSTPMFFLHHFCTLLRNWWYVYKGHRSYFKYESDSTPFIVQCVKITWDFSWLPSILNCYFTIARYYIWDNFSLDLDLIFLMCSVRRLTTKYQNDILLYYEGLWRRLQRKSTRSRTKTRSNMPDMEELERSI